MITDINPFIYSHPVEPEDVIDRDDETRKLLAGQRVVFLDVGLAAAVERIGLNRSRPLLAVNPRAELTRMLAERRPLYEQVATLVVTTDGRTAADVADEIDAALVGA